MKCQVKVKAYAPGRVNIIGEHTDYNQGYVLPMAVNMGILLTAQKRRDKLVNIYANNLDQRASFSLNKLAPGKSKNWPDYIAGICWALQEEGYKLSGADLDFGGNIPIAAGLSSSAALEVAAAAAFSYLNGLNIPEKKLALLSQKAENEYIGVRCGIMDQFASALSIKDCALFLDCRSLEYEHIPLDLGEHVFMIIDSRIKRSLAASAYNRRREECAEALTMINKSTGLQKISLREVSLQEIEKARPFMLPELYNRACFVIKENKRVLDAVKAFKHGDLQACGSLINQSHEGLRRLYEVSCKEVDMIVDAAQSFRGVLGARMTGAGFGGCVVALVRRERVEKLQERILEKTRVTSAKEPHFYITDPADGLKVTEVFTMGSP